MPCTYCGLFEKGSELKPPPQLAKTVDEYVERLGDWRGDLVQELRSLVTDVVPQAEESMIWGQVVFQLNGPMCFIKAFRNQVILGFWRGDQVNDPKSLLGKSIDRIRYLALTSDDEIRRAPLQQLVKSAAKLNREFGDPTKLS